MAAVRITAAMPIPMPRTDRPVRTRFFSSADAARRTFIDTRVSLQTVTLFATATGRAFGLQRPSSNPHAATVVSEYGLFHPANGGLLMRKPHRFVARGTPIIKVCSDR